MKGKVGVFEPQLREAKGVFRRLLCYQTRDVPILLCMFVWLDRVPLQEGNLGEKNTVLVRLNQSLRSMERVCL